MTRSPSRNTSALFTEGTFDLLRRLDETPTAALYLQNKDAFKADVEAPIQELMRATARRLPESITKVMETEQNVFAHILKNDYGQGGAWPFYWGAFYPKGTKRTEAPQLFLSINHERLDVGFNIGRYGPADRELFWRNVAAHRDQLSRLLGGSPLADVPLTYGRRAAQPIGGAGAPSPPLEDWLQHAAEGEPRVALLLPRDKVIGQSLEDLADCVARTYKWLFPLVLLAMKDDPMPAIRTYLHEAPPPPPSNPPYPLADMCEETGFPLKELEQWVRAIERKGQVILYGPPGTGKTYLAEHLARHLIGGGDGFRELVQFHPAYSYEDFIQGIRPQARPEGGLDFRLVPGRFLEFCDAARDRTGRCVLIIDEINRADLARVFGDLMYLLEYRNATMHLASGGDFAIPANVHLIGTMNTADRSIALVDHALRRRFAFLEIAPRYDVLRAYHAATGFPVEGLIQLLKDVNRQIDDPHYAIGITFFLRPDLDLQIEDIWRMEIEPYLAEYFFDRPAAAGAYTWDKVGASIQP